MFKYLAILLFPRLAVNAIEQNDTAFPYLGTFKWDHMVPIAPLKPWVQTSNRHYSVQGVGNIFQDLKK